MTPRVELFFEITLSGRLAERLLGHAKRRRLPAVDVLADIVDVVLRDDLVDAVLNDVEQAS